MKLTDKQIFDAIRERRGTPLTQEHVRTVNAIMYPPKQPETGLPWLEAAKSKIGQKEIPGPRHNNWIAAGWAKLGAGWFKDDETPWCGFFVAWALQQAGLTYPKNFPAAASFRDYGTACRPQVGAIAVKTRKGGNHVFFIVGETPDKRYFKALGGNQSNEVSIVDILKTSVDAIRWPAGTPLLVTGLPTLPAGKLSDSEA
jgi:uncharacterized protein (TIGR02594 family)